MSTSSLHLAGARRRLRPCLLALAALAGGLAIDVAIPRPIAFASSSVAPTLLHATWTQGMAISLPANAGTGAAAAPSLDSVSCYGAGDCTAAGSYKDSSSLVQAMVLTEADDTWGQGAEVSPPSDAGGQPDAELEGVSCVSAVSCSAVGSYQAAVGEQEAMAATETNGQWQRAVRVDLPSGAATDPEATLAAVSCANAGDCTAVGSYQDSSGVTEPMISTAAAGAFGVATEVSPPAGASSTPDTTLSAVSCFRGSDCTIVGSFVDSSSHTQAFYLTESDGTWGSATELTAPANAASNPDAVLDSVSCFDAVDCTAFGSYTDSSGHEQAMAATELGGTWAQATEVSAPANAYPDPSAELTAGSCSGAVTCTAVGTFEDLAADVQTMVVVEQDGTWSEAGELTAAADAGLDPATSMTGVSCPASESCAAVGDYTNLSGSPEAATFTELADPTFTIGQAASYTVVSVGSPTPALSESGALPAGIDFDDQGDGFGTISGTAASGSVGTSAFTVAADNGVGAASSQSFSALVNQAPTITNADSTTFTVLTPGSFQFVAAGNPAPTFSETGTLPSGVSLSSSGLLQGTPAASAGGSYPFTVSATNGIGSASTQSFTLAVTQGTQSISSAASTTFSVGTGGTFSFTATGGTSAATFSETGALPGGVSLSSAGVLAGIPAAGSGGLYPIVVSATNGVGSPATQDFTLTVNQAPAITSAGSATFTVGLAGSVTLTASGYPTPTFSESGTLPSGVTLASGVLSGTPTPSSAGGSGASTTTSPTGASGGTPPITSYPITLTVTNSAGSSTQSFTLTVNQAPSFTSVDTTDFTAGQAGTFHLSASGLPAPTFSETGALPPGVTLTSSGMLSGVPAAGSGGQYFVTLKAANGIGTPDTQLFTLNVDQPPKIVSEDRTTFLIDEIDGFSVQTSGFPAATVSVAGTLPAGVIFVNNEFTGVPTGAAPTASTTGSVGAGAATSTPPPSTGTAGTSTGTATGPTGATAPPVPSVYPVTLTASNGVGTSTAGSGSGAAGSTATTGVGSTDVQTFEIVLAKAPPAPRTAVPVVTATTVKALGGRRPTALSVRVACPHRRCIATLQLVRSASAAPSRAKRKNGRTTAIESHASYDELLGSAKVSTRENVAVRVRLNPAGRALFAAAARRRVTLPLALVETSGRTVRRIVVDVRA